VKKRALQAGRAVQTGMAEAASQTIKKLSLIEVEALYRGAFCFSGRIG
jgi:hypothetical protein